MLQPGSKLGPYEILSSLGAGGMGEVYKAADTRLGRTVAIKKLRTEHSDRFQNEARAIASLNHPNICQLYDIGPDYLVMEFVDGKPLEVHGKMPEPEAVRLAVQIASALEAAHQRGIIHRDLKPANVMVKPDGTVKLLDFGIAKLVTTSDADVTATMDGAIVGTVAYMSPEQLQGKDPDERSDVFSFGAVLYELVSGERAFTGGSTATVASAVLRDDPAPLQSHSSLGRIVLQCLQKQPQQRFQSMSQLKSALEDVSLKSITTSPSIAVLPFANMSADKENEYFSDGLAEEIINALAHMSGIKVTARTSAFAFRGKEQDIRKIAETLGVRTILEGSVRRAGNRVRVTAQLINAEDGYHLWSERFDRELTDIFALQDEIASAIATALQAHLAPTTMPMRRYKPKLAAYEAMLKGRYYGQKFTPESMKKATEYLQQAIALDPFFAQPHAELAFHFMLLSTTDALSARDAMPLVRAHAQKALEIDNNLPEAHAMLGVVAAVYDYDRQEAERRFQLALTSDHVSAFVRFNYGASHLVPMQRFSECLNQYRIAIEEDPLSAPGNYYLAYALTCAGEFNEAERVARKSLEVNESFGGTLAILGYLHFRRGDVENAVKLYEKAYALVSFSPHTRGSYAGCLALSSQSTRARAMLEPLGEGKAYGAAAAFVVYYLFTQDLDRAMDWFERMVDERYPVVSSIVRHPLFEPLHSNPRWVSVLRTLNLPRG